MVQLLFWISSGVRIQTWTFLRTVQGGGLGFGIYFDEKWSQACWPPSWQDSDILSAITFLDLFRVMAALHMWGTCLKNKWILFHIDNLSVVSIINKKSSKSPRAMVLVRKLVFACLDFN